MSKPADLPSRYDPSLTEDKWYDFWIKNGFFRSVPDHREPYCIVIPPPNVTGVLHMGHMLNNTIQDILVRRARMQGKNALWVPGTDHASIATEAKVVAKLKDDGIEKATLTRDQFLAHAWEWKEKHGGIILYQLRKLGASCDWERTCFTMDEPRYESVIDVFIDLFRKGMIYRGVRMVNWDPQALTALSDEEVNYKEIQSKLYYVRYRIEGTEDEWITIATTRPETILGDTAVCVHPADERYLSMKGKRVIIPLVNRSVPLIFDEYVDREFGTGALKITPAHDINDYNIGLKYHLESIDIFNPDGALSEKAILYVGEDRFVVREKITEDLKTRGHIVKIEDYTNKVGYSERTDVVIEPRISMQWFLRMDKLSAPALDAVMTDQVKFHPAKYKNMYRHWMENVKDWCISRQLWWGHRIPAWYTPDGEVVVARTREEAFRMASEQLAGKVNFSADDLKQDEDVLDTWFSSWLWPVSVFDGIRQPDNPDIRYYYPTNDLVTGAEIIFFWVARMIMAGQEYRQEIPFHNVYFTGIVRDKVGRKMSKSLGNSPDPIEMMNRNGADAVRLGMLLCSPAGNDLLFDETLVEQGRNFCNKIWNALRLVKSWQVEQSLQQPHYCAVSVEWFRAVLSKSLMDLEDRLARYRLSEALMSAYKLVWDDFCSWYLEMIKPDYGKPVDAQTLDQTISFFEQLVKLFHPFIPFITEEIWHHLRERETGETIMFQPYPANEASKQEMISQFEFVEQVIMAIRNFRKQKNIPQKQSISLFIRKNNNEKPDTTFDEVAARLCNLEQISYTTQKPENTAVILVGTTEFYIPLEEKVDATTEIAKLEDELKYQRGFLETVRKKLSNERFVNNASPQIVENERKKESDALARIKVIEAQLEELRKMMG